MSLTDTSFAISGPTSSHERGRRGPRRLLWSAGLLLALMLAASVLAVALRPKPRPPGQAPAIVLETAVPQRFGDWRVAPQAAVQVVNPQTQELLDKLYSQTLSRTYVDSRGYRVMLSLAYGDDQRGGLQAHMPEVCYPAQGFKLVGSAERLVTTPFGSIPARQLMTSLGARQEPITYWFAMGDRNVRSNWEKRIVELRLGLTGQVPDGLLVRISSIDGDVAGAYRVHEAFARDLLAALPPSERRKFSGLVAPAP